MSEEQGAADAVKECGRSIPVLSVIGMGWSDRNQKRIAGVLLNVTFFELQLTIKPF